MAKLFLLLLISFLSYVISNPIEYESISLDSYSNSRSDQVEIEDENDSFSADLSQRLYKRQIETDEYNNQLSLSEIIENIEDSLLDSAVGASNIYEILTSDTIKNKDNDDDTKSSEKDVEHIVAKREDDKDDTSKSSSASSSSEEKPDSDTVLTHFKAREVPISDEHSAHVAVDRVTVFVANPAFLPMIPSFDLHHSGVQHESIKEILEDAKNNSNSSEENDKLESTTSGVNADSTVETTTVAQTTTKNTPKKTAEELKEAEDELKEKVAEVEADPVILSARV